MSTVPTGDELAVLLQVAGERRHAGHLALDLGGADLALLAALRHDHIAARFPRVVIASGDHIFAPAVTGLAAAGCQVTVASRRDRLSPTLQHAASGQVIYLDPPATRPPATGHRPPAECGLRCPSSQ